MRLSGKDLYSGLSKTPDESQVTAKALGGMALELSTAMLT